MKKIIALLLTVVLTASVAIGGTVAYLQDSARNDNTMTMGKVDISQWEYQRATNEDGTYKTDTIDSRTSYVLEGFQQDKPLLPAITPNGGTFVYDSTPVRMSQVNSHGGASVFNTPNAVDKFVVVENTGKTDAYVRTLIAFEIGSKRGTDVMSNLILSEIRAGTEANGSMPWTYGDAGTIQIDGKNYFYYEFIYTGAMTSSGWKHENGVLPAGETTYPSLCQVYMTSKATNEDVAALDGNGNGKYDIIVLSQAVQADGWTAADGETVAELALDTAFGDANTTNVASWFADVAPGDETSPADPNATGTITPGYTKEDRIWGECTSSAKNSLVVKAYSGDTYMGSSSLNNIDGIIDGDVTVTWNLYLDPASHTDGYWTTNWAIAPTINQQPTKVELWVDGTKVAESAVQLNGPDSLNKIGGAVTDSTGKILKYVVGDVQPELGTGEQYHSFS